MPGTEGAPADDVAAVVDTNSTLELSEAYPASLGPRYAPDTLPPPPRERGRGNPAHARRAPVAVEARTGTGDASSLSGELLVLRRERLKAAALFLTATYLTLFLWNFFGRESETRTVWALMGLRVIVAAGAACVLAAPLRLTRVQVRSAEYTLFGGLTALLVLSQYVVNLDLMRRGDVPGAIAFTKNGVIQAFAMMVLYGTFIPNDPRTAARVVLSMAAGPVLALALLAVRTDVAAAVETFRSAEQVGSNVVFLAIGAALAVYGAKVLNTLRVELHEAKKFGRYTLVRKLGSGGMGDVFLAEHQFLKRPCALKLIKQGARDDQTALARFEREVRAASRLSHPNSIEIYDYGVTDDGTFFYVMEYLPGLGLDDLVKRHGPLPPGRVIYLLRQVCAGLGRAHGLGLIHRDLKPANIYVAVRGGEFDVAKVLDFGLVKQTRDPTAVALTADRHVSGTPLYMAPEQATGSPHQDARLDLYALGGVAYFTLTGRPPFDGETALAVMIAHARDPVVPPSKLRQDVPADLEAVILKCLSKKPDDRYPSAKALSQALAACAAASEWGPEEAEKWWADVIGPGDEACGSPDLRL